MSKASSGGGCGGFILMMFLLWALCFGVTWNSVHYQIACDTQRGVHLSH